MVINPGTRYRSKADKRTLRVFYVAAVGNNFISSGESGGRIFHRRPILGFPVHRCQRFHVHRIGFVSVSNRRH
jgi:hypothetical protein